MVITEATTQEISKQESFIYTGTSRIKLLRSVQEVYAWRRAQTIALWDKVLKRAQNNKISLNARNIEETDIMFEGYYTRYNNLLGRLNDLDNEYTAVLLSMGRESFWYKILGWLPFMKINKETEVLMKDFLDKWSKYEPGW